MFKNAISLNYVYRFNLYLIENTRFFHKEGKSVNAVLDVYSKNKITWNV
jgi:hypothetical protein